MNTAELGVHAKTGETIESGLVQDRMRRALGVRPNYSLSGRFSSYIHRIRNCGVIAHVDAGKTTTTERLLFYANKIRAIGDVDRGDTTMDFLEEERERGITIRSAAITFEWNRNEPGSKLSNPHRFNLIDTPGHADFTAEVQQAVSVLDGAVIVLDAVRGVQAQTETVWRQAQQYRVPCLCFINKMDRPGATFDLSVESIRKRLVSGSIPVCAVPIQIPIGEGPNFCGVIDLIEMEALVWPPISHNHDSGDRFARFSLLPQHPASALPFDSILDSPLCPPWLTKERASQLLLNAWRARSALCDALTDDTMAIDSKDIESLTELLLLADRDPLEPVIEQSRHCSDAWRQCLDSFHASMSVDSSMLRRMLRQSVVHQPHNDDKVRLIPILCGASAKNRAVQPILDAMVDYLPAPNERPAPPIVFGESRSSGKRRGGRSPGSDSKSATSELIPDENKPLVAFAFKVQQLDIANIDASTVTPMTNSPSSSGNTAAQQQVVFVRLFSGHLAEKQSLVNSTMRLMSHVSSGEHEPSNQHLERCGRVLQIDAHRCLPLSRPLKAGEIGALVGLKHVRTGDTLLAHPSRLFFALTFSTHSHKSWMSFIFWLCFRIPCDRQYAVSAARAFPISCVYRSIRVAKYSTIVSAASCTRRIAA